MADVSIRNVVKSFANTPVLRGVSIDVSDGEFVSLVGPSGCGKSTLLRIVAGLESADTGSVSIGDRDVTRIRAADRDVAMVFQNYALYPHLTVAQNLAVPLAMRQLTAWQRIPFVGRFVGDAAQRRAAIQAETRRTAGMLGIEALMGRKPAQLSGGQRQRVALGRAIVRHPHVFLMDEPLSNLDAALRVQTRAEIVSLHRRVGAATIYVTHDQAEAMTMSDRVAVMMDGEILQVSSPETIYTDPVDMRVAAFIGSPAINLIPAQVRDDGAIVAEGVPAGLVTAARGPVTLAIRPECLAPRSTGMAARVNHIEFLGDSVLLHAILVESGTAVICRVPPEGQAPARVGEIVRLGADAGRSLLFDHAGRRAAARSLALETVDG